jgi:serine/threonine-protein kinase
LKPGLAVDILRGCLAGLAALHHDNIAHCDLKPSNIMIKRTGTKKIVDIDSSCVLAPQQRAVRGTPYYMAPEQLHERRVELGSDIAALGYVLIEMLTGKQLFRHCKTKKELLEAKLVLPNRLD